MALPRPPTACATRCGWPGDDLQGGGGRARPRRRQGRDLRPRRRAPGRTATAARCCSTSATWSSRSTAATSPPRTSASAPEDMAVIGERTRHVTGLPADHGGSGDPSPFTALGVEAAMRACARERFGSPDLAGRRIVIAGLGHVGSKLARLLAEAGAELAVSDIDPAKRRLATELDAEWVEPRARCWPSATCWPRARSAGRSTPPTAAAALRDRLRLRQQPARRRGPGGRARRARDPLRARLRRQRRRADPRLPGDPRLLGARGTAAGARHRGEPGSRPRRPPSERGITPCARPASSPRSASTRRGKSRRASRERLSARGRGLDRPGRPGSLRGGARGAEAPGGGAPGRRDPRPAAAAGAPARLHQGPPLHARRAADGRGLVPDAGDRGHRHRSRRPGHLPRARPAGRLPDRLA